MNNSSRRFHGALNHFYSIILSEDSPKNSYSGLNMEICLFRSQISKINKNQTLFILEGITLTVASNEPSSTFTAYFEVEICVEKRFLGLIAQI